MDGVEKLAVDFYSRQSKPRQPRRHVLVVTSPVGIIFIVAAHEDKRLSGHSDASAHSTLHLSLNHASPQEDVWQAKHCMVVLGLAEKVGDVEIEIFAGHVVRVEITENVSAFENRASMSKILRVRHSETVGLVGIDDESARREFVRMGARHVLQQVVRTPVIDQDELGFFVVGQILWKSFLDVLGTSAASYAESNHRGGWRAFRTPY